MVWPRQPHNRPVATRWADEAKSSQLLAIIINFRFIKRCTSRVGADRRAVRSFRTKIDHGEEKVWHFGHSNPLTAHAPVGRNGLVLSTWWSNSALKLLTAHNSTEKGRTLHRRSKIDDYGAKISYYYHFSAPAWQ